MALAGQPVAYFSNVAVFASAEGATFCYQDALQRGAEGGGGSLGRQFGTLFVDPDNVVVTPVEFPTLGEQSLALTVSGDTLAQGNRVGIVVLLVTFRQGPATATVGAVKAVLTPTQAEVEPLARLVSQRIQEEFGP